ncbi:hypothetical protein KEM56_006936 [Ascosphaera pollenicola]|nr:hypothetical protein KEM56_006936 [Ascosphaera pollenicola]
MDSAVHQDSPLTTYGRIIVGVKYCFRHRRRIRRQSQSDDVMAIDLLATPQPRRHRRRKEKKLMTMDEVNGLFPLTKYKAWRSIRASKGLSTSGGISVPSRAPSIKGDKKSSVPTVEIIERVDSGTSYPSEYPQLQRYLVNSENQSYTSFSAGLDRCSLKDSTRIETQPCVSFSLVQPSPNESDHENSKSHDCEEKADARPQLSRQASHSSFRTARSVQATPISLGEDELGERETGNGNNDEEDDEPIHHVTTAEYLDSSGDTCAVCLDSIEDDDDIRGLKCDHTFHASCIDPWLTTRRACCPLCKADYYIPKPRPEEITEPERAARPPRRGTRQQENASRRNRSDNGNNSGPIFPSWFMSSRSMTTLQAFLERQSPEMGNHTLHDSGPPGVDYMRSAADTSFTSPRPYRIRSIRPSLHRLRNFGRTRDGTTRSSTHGREPAMAPDPTPRQLESGQA